MHATEVARPTRKRDREVREGWWVVALREEMGRRQGVGRAVSQMRLANLAGRHVSAVSRWEADDGEIDYLSWVGLLALAEMPLDWEPPETPPAPAGSDDGP